MNVDGEKIKQLIEVYGVSKGYSEKSYLPKFCEDFNVNYTQWNAYCRGSQKMGTKIIDLLIDVFPDINLNWLLKEEKNMFTDKENPTVVLKEPETKYFKRKIGNEDIYDKLDDILEELKRQNKN